MAIALGAAPVKFEIPAQPAPAALMAFSKQAGAEVVYSADDLKAVRANEVKGEFEPEAALGALLQGTGFTHRRNGGGKFVVTAAVSGAGTLRGTLIGPDGRPVEGVTVRVKETDRSVLTDRNGDYVLTEVPAGQHIVMATAEGYQPLHITDVRLRSGREVIVGRQLLRRLSPADDTTKMEPFVVQADSVTEMMDPFEVSGARMRPFADSNVDIPRTINDPQAYYIFNQRAIEQSGVTNIEDFLRERLTMGSSFVSNSQSNGAATPFSQKTTSSFGLRGLATGGSSGQQLVVLVNGRRLAALAQQGSDYQTDLNGVPLGAIDRIEVLPASASGIYGSGAVSGVINIVLKRHYAGTDLRVTYTNTFDKDAPVRQVDLTSGFALEGGKTNLLFTAAWSDGSVALLQDREKYYRANLARLLANTPAVFTASGSSMFVGATPNIFSTTPLAGLGSNVTYIPAGYRGFALDGLAPLAANAGRQNYEPAPTANYHTGLRSRIGAAPEVRSLHATIRRAMAPWLEMFVEGSYRANIGTTYYGNLSTIATTVAATAPTNPFRQQVSVAAPSTEEWLAQSSSVSRTFTVGFTAKLPRNWQAQLDYSWNGAKSNAVAQSRDFTAFAAAVNAGTVDLFRDTLRYGLDYTPYREETHFQGPSSLNETALRAAGVLWFMPWIKPSLVVSANHRKEGRDDQRQSVLHPTNSALADRFNVYPGQSQSTAAYYVEATLPLVTAKNAIPGVQLLDVQVAGRREEFTVRNTRPLGPGVLTVAYNPLAPPAAGFGTSIARYASNQPTFGGRWQPLRDVMLRGSYARGFVAPTFAQLNPGNPSATPTNVVDPRRGGQSAAVIPDPVGGNPDVTPENSENWNGGVVLTPRFLPGLRLAVDYTFVIKRNNIATLSAQQIVNNEALFPGRVTRGAVPAGDPFGFGPIVGINTTALNLHKQIIEAYDISANYRKPTESLGVFELTALASYQPHLQQRTALGAPLLEYANSPSSGGVLKLRGNLQLTWDYKRWTVGWATQYYNSYKQLAAPLTTATTPVLSQGSPMIASQMYHDTFLRYRAASAGADAKWWLRPFGQMQVQVGIRNVFDKVPPFDANRASTYYFSPYGDLRLRSYYLSLRRTF